MSNYTTEQEKFWEGEFGIEYVNRNRYDIGATLAMFSKILSKAYGVDSLFEFGCNIGQNLRALKLLKSQCRISGIDQFLRLSLQKSASLTLYIQKACSSISTQTALIASMIRWPLLPTNTY
jgi:hypothetical protein